MATQGAGSKKEDNILLKDMAETFSYCLDTARAKNADYAGGDSFKNFLNAKVVGVSVQRGILVRMMDKISRVNTLLDSDAQVTDESICDTLDDLINYTAILKSSIKNKIE